MTVLEASNVLVEFFARNDYFHFETDFVKVCLISDTDADKAAVILALEELAKQNFVIKKDIKGQEYWVLVKPLGLHTQDIEINLITALAITETINKFIKEDKDKVNPFRISANEIHFLLELISNLTKK